MGGGGRCRLVDLKTGSTYETNSFILTEYEAGEDGGVRKGRIVEELQLVKRGLDLKDYHTVLEALSKLLKASIETGNPVIWC